MKHFDISTKQIKRFVYCVPLLILSIVFISLFLQKNCEYETAEALTITGRPAYYIADSFEEYLEYSTPKEEPKEEVYEIGSYNYYCNMVARAALEHGLDPVLCVAVSRLESGNYESDIFVSLHNFAGLSDEHGLISYASEEDGLEAFMRTMDWYKDEGLVTPEDMAPRYCPVNKDWARLVRQIMKEVEPWT